MAGYDCGNMIMPVKIIRIEKDKKTVERFGWLVNIEPVKKYSHRRTKYWYYIPADCNLGEKWKGK